MLGEPLHRFGQRSKSFTSICKLLLHLLNLRRKRPRLLGLEPAEYLVGSPHRVGTGQQVTLPAADCLAADAEEGREPVRRVPQRLAPVFQGFTPTRHILHVTPKFNTGVVAFIP